MTTLPLTTARGRRTSGGPRRLLRELDGAPALGHVGPNWFASVMGTGIVAVALDGLPFALPGADVAATAMWLLSVAVLVVVTAATVGHHVRHPVAARGHLGHPVMSLFYGAPAMALMTVGTGTLLVGDRLVGAGPAVAVDAVLWTLGTALGLLTAAVVPHRAITRHRLRADAAFGGWLMPVVPPMVSAATGALLVPHLPAGRAQQAALAACWLFFGVALVGSTVAIALVVRRLVRHGGGPAATVPTLWIVLGPLGQSVTAVHHLGAQHGPASRALVLVYGLPVLGTGLLWLVAAAVLTLRTARTGLPFNLTWWSFTFPVGTMVTGASALAAATGLVLLQVVAAVLLAGLLVAWTTVAVRTLAGVLAGRLLLAPVAA